MLPASLSLDSFQQQSPVLDMSADSIIIHDLDGNIIFANKAAYESRGYMKEEMFGMKLSKILALEQIDFFPQRLSEIFKKGELRFESSHLRKDDSVITVETHVKLIEIEGNKYCCSVIRDITERKQADEALRQSREQLDLALISSKMAVFEWDIVKNKRTWSYGVHRLLGTKPETFTGAAQEFFQIIHPEDRSTVQADLGRAVETGQYATEYRAVWQDGSIHHIAARGKIHRDNTGQAVQMTGVCWDISDSKQAEAELRSVTQRLKLATQSAKLGVWDWDITNNIMIWNDRMLELYGLTPETFPGRVEAWVNGLHPDDSAKAIAESEAALRGEKEFDTEFRVIHPDGSVKVLKANAIMIRDAYGKPVRMIGLNRDNTELREAEEKLRGAYTDLEIKVQERTAELSAANIALMTEIKVRKLTEETL
ncbi:MAG: PAS domain-containing protein, partial [Dissulfurispiraceae bacterium]